MYGFKTLNKLNNFFYLKFLGREEVTSGENNNGISKG
jgi:hypothetical protein